MPESLRRFGRYIELKHLAAGGMGEIVLAEHTGLSGFAKRVAIKRIKSEVAKQPSYGELFLNEARLGSFLNHPNIVHIFDVGQDENGLWLAMEYVEGVDLKRLARRARRAEQSLPGPVVAAIGIEVLAALHEAHHGGPVGAAPIIHRDLSPENILITKSGGIKVLDFGLAKWIPKQHSVPSLEGDKIFGKVRYMPPEQLRGQFLDPRADLFSLGATLYETLRGELPFGKGSAAETLHRIQTASPPSPTEHIGSDEELDWIISKALSPTRGRRFASAQDMREAFLQYLEQRPTPRLPLEHLRQLLTPLARESTVNEEGRFTDLALPVFERCGKCGGEFVAELVDDMIVDHCKNCGGLWLERDEVLRLVGRDGTTQRPAQFPALTPNRLDIVVGVCPVDRSPLKRYPIPHQPVALEVCPSCLGVWFDRDEMSLLQSRGVSTWLRYLLDNLGIDSGSPPPK
ncbi:MAG: protein kinase [Myxococcales bacterium]|nr:protein kinase [Myxococcales bacterium]